MGALYLFLTRSWTGRAMRATADDPFVGRRASASTYGALTSPHSWSEPALRACRHADGHLHGRTPTIGNDFIVIMFLAIVLGRAGQRRRGRRSARSSSGSSNRLSGLLLPLQLQNVTLFVVFVAILLRPPARAVRIPAAGLSDGAHRAALMTDRNCPRDNRCSACGLAIYSAIVSQVNDFYLSRLAALIAFWAGSE